MKIKNILVSQPAPSATEKSPFQEIVQKYNLKLDFVPFIKVEGASTKEFRAQRIDILAHTAIIFTSRTTIDNFFRICEEARVVIPETMKYFCVTEAIALYLQKYIVYRKRKIFFGKGTFTDLAELIVKHGDEKYVLPLVEPHKLEVPKALDKLKVKYSKLIIAHTVSADLKSVNFDSYDMMVFYSPAEINALANHLSDNVKTPLKPFVATFGNGTALAAVNSGLKVNVLAPTPESPSMTKAIDVFIQKYHANEPIDTVKIDRKDNVASILKVVQPKTIKKTTKSTPAKTGTTKSAVRTTPKVADKSSEAKAAVKAALEKSEKATSVSKSVLAKRAK